MAGQFLAFSLALLGDALGRSHFGVAEGQNDVTRFGIDTQCECSERNARERQRDRKLKRAPMPAKRAREFDGEPAPRPEFAAIARFVNLSVSPADQPFQVRAQVAFGSERGDLGQIRRSTLIHDVKTLQLLESELARGIGIDPVEGFFERGPMRTLGFDEAGQIEDHKSCRCLTSS